MATSIDPTTYYVALREDGPGRYRFDLATGVAPPAGVYAARCRSVASADDSVMGVVRVLEPRGPLRPDAIDARLDVDPDGPGPRCRSAAITLLAWIHAGGEASGR
jgi:hypothetical protein